MTKREALTNTPVVYRGPCVVADVGIRMVNTGRHASKRLTTKPVNLGNQGYDSPVSNVHPIRSSSSPTSSPANLLFADPGYAVILETIARMRERVGFLPCGYVLMPDHWHALIWSRFPVTISGVIQNVKRASSFKLNRLRSGRGLVWQHQFWDRFLRHAQELRERLDYMDFNPVRKGLVKHPEDSR